MHPHLNFETSYIKFQEEFSKFAFFQKLVLKLKIMIYYFTYVAYFLRYPTCCFRKLTNVSKKKRFNVIKRGKSFKFQIGGLTYQMKICLLYTSPSPRDGLLSRMPSSA